MARLKKLVTNAPGKTINELRIILALERAVHRLERHPRLSNHLIFKGGFVLLKTIGTHRFTRDLDALAFEISKEEVPSLVIEALTVDLGDGLWFGDILTQDLMDQGKYGGLRFNCAYQIGEPPLQKEKIKKLSRIHIDIGFGDEMDSPPQRKAMNSILIEIQPVSWLVYSLETIFSEKLETLISRGSLNSRAKDLYDLVVIFDKYKDNLELGPSIELTFRNRNTPLPKSFFEAASKFDLEMLKTSWSSVLLTETSKSFDEVWILVLQIFRELDAK